MAPSYGPCEVDDIKKRMRRAIATLPPAEVDDILEEQGKVELTCEMCKVVASWTREELEADKVEGDGESGR